jgi:hypothetical protein
VKADLTDFMRQSAEAFKAMSPEKQREMLRAQRKSWVIGELMLEHPDMTREEAEKLYERADDGC